MNEKVAVVIPCYKTKNQIKDVIKTIPNFINFIIVIDDACPEGSGKEAEGIKDPRLIVIFHKKNQGTGGAIITGHKKALELGSDIIVKIDGDGQMDNSIMAEIIKPIVDGKADYVKGNRFYDFKSLKKMPVSRLMGNSILSFLYKFTSGYWGINDVANGYTAISRKALLSLNLDKLAKDYFFDSDVLLNMGIQNFRLSEVATTTKYGDEISSLNIFNIALTFPFRILKLFLKRIWLQYFLYNFNMVSIYLLLGIPMILWGSIFGLYRWYMGVNYGVVNNAGVVMLAILPIILGVQLLLQAIAIDMSNKKN